MRIAGTTKLLAGQESNKRRPPAVFLPRNRDSVARADGKGSGRFCQWSKRKDAKKGPGKGRGQRRLSHISRWKELGDVRFSDERKKRKTRESIALRPQEGGKEEPLCLRFWRGVIRGKRKVQTCSRVSPPPRGGSMGKACFPKEKW